jgi:exopolyphosphatase / guanosine-5'-triphosphate,3'-diphosphate pyrophosphatase
MDGPLRVGVLDVGCFSAHLVVVDGDRPMEPVASYKIRLRLDREIDQVGRISADGIEQISAAVGQATKRAEHMGMPPVVAYATSSIRDAANAEQVVKRVARRTGVELELFSPEREAYLSYVAARRWFGCAAGMVTVLDVGGGTAELAAGAGPHPLTTHSIPIGARTLARAGLENAKCLAKMRAELVEQVRATMPQLPGDSSAVGCSKVFQQLARLAGARPQREGLYVARTLRLEDLTKWIPRLAKLPAHRRAELPGISPHRARQSLAGAVLAETLMRVTGHDAVTICPWSTKEGLLITLLDCAPDAGVKTSRAS